MSNALKPSRLTQSQPSTEVPVADLLVFCNDLDNWPNSWRGEDNDIIPGQKMIAYFRPFIVHLVDSNFSKKTIRNHVDNLWVLGGEIIRDLNMTPKLRKVPVEELVFNILLDGGPILYHSDSDEQQRSFQSTCRKFRRFLKSHPT